MPLFLREILPFLQAFFPYFIITLTVWITYCYVLKCGFVSDDILGILAYDGILQTKTSEAIKYNEKLSETDKKTQLEAYQKKPFLSRLFNSEYGMISRWLRYQICGGNKPSKRRFKIPDGKGGTKDGDFIPEGKIPYKHHLLIVTAFNTACLLTYKALVGILGAKLTLLTLVLFIVHPCGVQAVAWCSGLGYPLSLFWISAMLTVVPPIYHSPSVIKTIILTFLFVFFQFMGIHAQMIPLGTCLILWLLGYKVYAILGGVVSFIMFFDIIKQTVDYRTDEFKKQEMGASTEFHPMKFIVAMKTLLYYLGLSLFPARMGLYHEWGFHYDDSVKKIDKVFLLGFIAFLGLLGILFTSHVMAIQLSILWFLAFSVIFWNWITVQQWVTERYIWIPSLGVCLLISYFTQNYLYVYSLILGLYLCRTWMHLPTYDNEMRFYQSNHWNFQKSEVALGNLGVNYLNHGLEGMALDVWKISSTLNPDYDVPWYNTFSYYKTRAGLLIQQGLYVHALQILQQAMPFLEKTLKCSICHFPKLWKKEHKDLLMQLSSPHVLLWGEMIRLKALDITLKKRIPKAKTKEELDGINVSLVNNDKQIKNLDNFLRENGIVIMQGLPPNARNLLAKLTNPTKGE